jgi:isopentenyl diphosphate isomerase/L-lactate dehydrogenase-like FMN-dependent dehydrogenase
MYVAYTLVVGRPFAYGLALGGAEGVAHVIRTILADTEVSLGLSGHASLSEIQGKGEEIIMKVDC